MNSLNQRFSNSSSEDVTMNNHISRTFSDTSSESEIGRKACLKTNILYLQHPPNKSKVQGAPSLDFPKDHLDINIQINILWRPFGLHIKVIL